MPIAINGSGTVTGISVGGLPDGIVDADMLASNAVTAGKLASGVGGKIIQVVNTTSTAEISLATAAEALNSYNNAALRATITASNASNLFLITGQISIGTDGVAVSVILQDSGTAVTGAIGDTQGNRRRATTGGVSGTGEGIMTIPIHALITAGDTNSHTFHYAFFHNSGGSVTIYLNGTQSGVDSVKRGKFISNITVMEIAA